MKLPSLSTRLFLLLLVLTALSCGSQEKQGEQAKLFLSSVQNHHIDQCIEMTYMFHAKLASISNEPQFKKDKMVEDIRNEIRSGILNQYENDNIIYVLKFPCQWQIMETKKVTQESTGLFSNVSTINRVFVGVKYNSMDNSPESSPLINKNYKSSYKIKEMILHCDFDADTGLYMDWGVDSHTQW
jgi:hypothetical protein